MTFPTLVFYYPTCEVIVPGFRRYCEFCDKYRYLQNLKQSTIMRLSRVSVSVRNVRMRTQDAWNSPAVHGTNTR